MITIRSLLGAGLLVMFAASAAQSPIPLAIFDFELEDFSAGASSADIAPADATHLGNVTTTVRQLFAKSGRYRLVDIGNPDAAAVKTRTLRDCNGCDADYSWSRGAARMFKNQLLEIPQPE